MRKLTVIALALLFFTLGANTVMAALADDSFPVKIRLLEYAYVEVPEILDLGKWTFTRASINTKSGQPLNCSPTLMC